MSVPGYLWHLFEQVDRHAVGCIEVYSETMEGSECVVGSNSVGNWDNFANEAGGFGHEQLKSPASVPSI